MARLAKRSARKGDSGAEISSDAGISITRDAAFSRVVADRALIQNLGRDYDVSFLQVGSEPMSLAFRDADGQTVFRSSSRGVINEVVRVRMSPECASSMAMQILDELIKADQVDNDMVLSTVQQMIDTAQSDTSE
jgi:hypothetical protein